MQGKSLLKSGKIKEYEMKVHILTLNWNGLHHLKALYPSLLKVMGDIDYIWYVRDNGSSDGSVAWLNNKDKIKIQEINHNRASFSNGMNSLYEEIQFSDNDDLILFLNNDVIFNDAESLGKMIGLQKRVRAGIVGARLLYKDTNKLQHSGTIFSKKYNYLPYHYRLGEESDKQAETNRYFQAVTAACALVTRSSFEKVGGFDSQYQWMFEDVDLCLKIGQFSKIAYCGGTNIYHEESASLKKNPINRMFMSKNVEIFRKKWSGKYKIDHELYLKNKNYNIIK